jgi:hypothetical protein
LSIQPARISNEFDIKIGGRGHIRRAFRRPGFIFAGERKNSDIGGIISLRYMPPDYGRRCAIWRQIRDDRSEKGGKYWPHAHVVYLIQSMRAIAASGEQFDPMQAYSLNKTVRPPNIFDFFTEFLFYAAT